MVAIKTRHTVPTMTPGTNSMLRARRKDKDVRPNRLLDRTASRGMLYENEELRLRTININADLEKGQQYIKKLRRENSQLRREIWNLRDQYDKLESIMRNQEQEQEQYYVEEQADDDTICDPEDEETLSVVEEENENDDTRIQDQSQDGKMRNQQTQSQTTITDDEIKEITKQFVSLGDLIEVVNISTNTPPKNDVTPNDSAENAPPTAGAQQFTMCTLKTCDDFVNLFRKCCYEETALVFAADEFENLTVQEVIDNLESQYKEKCHTVIKGVRLTGKNCYITVNDTPECETLLDAGLKIRDKLVNLQHVWERSTILQLSAVPHYVVDEQIISTVSRFADVIGQVQRQTYKGFDTGERYVHIKTPELIPYQILLGSICIPITIVYPRYDDKPNIARRKSFRSAISINLKTPQTEGAETSPKSGGDTSASDSGTRPDDSATTKCEPSFFAKSTGVVLTEAEVENNVFQFPTTTAATTTGGPQSSVQNNVAKKKNVANTSNAPPAKDAKNAASESPSAIRKFTKRRVNSIRKTNAEGSVPPSPAPLPSTSKIGARKSSVNFINGPGECSLKTRYDNHEYGFGYMRDRSASDASSGRISICRRKLSVTGHEGSGKIPWCGCWGIGCC